MIKKLWILGLMIFALACGGAAQSPFRIQAKCRPPNASTYGNITVINAGDIRVTPCPTRSTIFSGLVDFSGATVTGVVTGTGTTNFIPRYTNGAAGVIGNTPFSWNGTSYAWNNTALNSDFTMSLNPTTGAGGSFLVGDSTSATQNYIEILDGASIWVSSGTLDLQAANGGNIANIGITAAGGLNFTSSGATQIRPAQTAGATFAPATGVTTLGDLTFAGSFQTIDDNGTIQLFASTELILGGNPQSLRVVQGSDTLRSTLATWDMSAAGGAGFGVTNYLYSRTITAAGTTGNQTINLPAGTVNFAAGAGAAGLTVTNSTVTANSIVLAVIRTNDATCNGVASVVPAAGSFVIRLNANCTAETSVGFLVTN